MTTVISFGNSNGWMEAIWPEIEPEAGCIIEELNSLYASETEGRPRPDCPNFDETRARIKTSIVGFDLCAFHATRAITPDRFIESGLKVLDKKRLVELADDICSSLNTPEFEISFEGYEIPENRKGKVWLTLVRPTREIFSGFKELLCCFGGEILGEILRGSDLDCNVIAQIRSLGSPLIVECHLPIGNLNETEIDSITKAVIRHTLNNCNNTNYELELPNLKVPYDICPQYIHQVCSISVECEAN